MLPMKPDYLTGNFHVKVSTTLARAHKRGLDPVEELHRAGLLLTPVAYRRIRLEAIQFIAQEMTSWRPAEFLRTKFLASHPASPSDMYSCIVEWLERHVSVAEDRLRNWKEDQ